LNIINPRSQIIPELYKHIIKAENIGDLHIKMMLKYPEQFAIRKEIVTMFLISFYKLLWNKDDDLSKKLNLEILSGDHKESAFVEVRSEHV
jgi:Glu-tRNA(Gln) amidotransferase subunit E-like FAD-binding protein